MCVAYVVFIVRQAIGDSIGIRTITVLGSNAVDKPPGIEREKFQLQPGDAPLYPFYNWLSKLP